MPLPIHRHHSDDHIELVMVEPVKKGAIIKPIGPLDAYMRGRLAQKGDKGVLVVAGHDGEIKDMVACYWWFAIEDKDLVEGKFVVLDHDGGIRVKATKATGDRVIGETIEGGVLLSPNTL